MKSLVLFVVLALPVVYGCTCSDCSDNPEYCIYGEDQTCNDDEFQSSLAGTCNEDQTCTCNGGYENNPATGKCRPASGNCVYGQNQTCNENPELSVILGSCSEDLTCSCGLGFELNEETGKCIVPEEIEKCFDTVETPCGTRYSGTTVGGLNEWNSYNVSARAENGPEQIFTMKVVGGEMQPTDCRAMARLTDISEDLDLFVLNSCDSFDAQGFSSTPLDIQDIESVAFDVHYYRFIAVDGYDGAEGSFNLEIDCLCNAIDDFDDGEYIFSIDSEWNGETVVTSSDDELPEEDYVPVTGGNIHVVSVTDSWAAIVIDENLYTGEIVPSSDGKLHYDLVSGAFAGGRLIIYGGYSDENVRFSRGELTLYGSGVYISASYRGTFEHQ